MGVRLVSLLYCAALRQVSTSENKNYELIDIKDFDHASLKFLEGAHDRCEVCLQWIQRLIGEANDKQTIKFRRLFCLACTINWAMGL